MLYFNHLCSNETIALQTQQASKKASFIITLKNMALEIGPVLNVFKVYFRFFFTFSFFKSNFTPDYNAVVIFGTTSILGSEIGNFSKMKF